jgi:hypothetical protein
LSDILQISIPNDLARFAVWQRAKVHKYDTNATIKALDTWLILKHLSRPSLIQNWNKQKADLLFVCKISEAVFRTRLRILAAMNLVKYDRHNIQLCSWEHLAKTLCIDLTKKTTIQYDITNKQRVQEWIIATEIKENQDRQAYKVIQKLKENPAVKLKVIHAMLAAGADRSKIEDSEYLLQWLMILYMRDFRLASDIHDELILLRPDTNRGVRAMADHWKAKNATTVSYWKKILQSTGIINVAKLAILSLDRVRNQHCNVKWVKGQKQTLLPMCDQITMLTPWLINGLENKAAA